MYDTIVPSWAGSVRCCWGLVYLLQLHISRCHVGQRKSLFISGVISRGVNPFCWRSRVLAFICQCYECCSLDVRERGMKEKGQTPESGIPPSFRATVRYSKVCLGLWPQFSALIGQLGRVPLFGARPWRYIRSWLFSSAFTVLWRAVTASWRENRGGKQLFLRVLRATEPHSTLPTLCNFRMYLS